ncbi:MAG: hypothetical protein ABJJ53_06315 [Sulfitobacter sp.]
MLAAGIELPAHAQNFCAGNDAIAGPTAAGSCVARDADWGARDMWWAAVGNARCVGQASGAPRVYGGKMRKTGMGQRSTVVFTANSAGVTYMAATFLGALSNTSGGTLSIGHAFSFYIVGGSCSDRGR